MVKDKKYHDNLERLRKNLANETQLHQQGKILKRFVDKNRLDICLSDANKRSFDDALVEFDGVIQNLESSRFAGMMLDIYCDCRMAKRSIRLLDQAATVLRRVPTQQEIDELRSVVFFNMVRVHNEQETPPDVGELWEKMKPTLTPQQWETMARYADGFDLKKHHPILKEMLMFRREKKWPSSDFDFDDRALQSFVHDFNHPARKFDSHWSQKIAEKFQLIKDLCPFGLNINANPDRYADMGDGYCSHLLLALNNMDEEFFNELMSLGVDLDMKVTKSYQNQQEDDLTLRDIINKDDNKKTPRLKTFLERWELSRAVKNDEEKSLSRSARKM